MSPSDDVMDGMPEFDDVDVAEIERLFAHVREEPVVVDDGAIWAITAAVRTAAAQASTSPSPLTSASASLASRRRRRRSHAVVAGGIALALSFGTAVAAHVVVHEPAADRDETPPAAVAPTAPPSLPADPGEADPHQPSVADRRPPSGGAPTAEAPELRPVVTVAEATPVLPTVSTAPTAPSQLPDGQAATDDHDDEPSTSGTNQAPADDDGECRGRAERVGDAGGCPRPSPSAPRPHEAR